MSQHDEGSAVRRMILQCKAFGRTVSDTSRRITQHQVTIYALQIPYLTAISPDAKYDVAENFIVLT